MKIKAWSFLPGAIALMLVASPIIPVFTNPAIAQPPHQGQGEGRGPFAQLNLTTEQKAKIKEIRESAKQQMDAIFTAEQKEQLRTAREQRQRPNLNLTEDQKAKLQAIRQDTESQIEAVLTAEQKQKLQELRQQWRQNHPPRGERPESN
jgi:periplasmic protein CpxP/Spy